MDNDIISLTPKGILAIGAHPDDIELGCGSSLASLAKQGYYVIAVVMTAGSKGCKEDIDRHDEARQALQSLGCKQVFLLHFEDTRTQNQINQMINALEDIISNRIPADIKINRVYTMSDSDRHQDHRAVNKASIVACRHISQVFAYETPSTSLTFVPQVFEALNEQLFNKKLQALAFHKSQQHREYMSHKHLRTVAQFRGQQAGCELSEGFVVHKMIL